MTEAIVGTWRFLKYVDGRDSDLPGTYTFNSGGSGSFDLPNGLSLPMRWKVVGGRLRFGIANNQSTVDIHFPDDDRLVLTDNNGLGVVYERMKG